MALHQKGFRLGLRRVDLLSLSDAELDNEKVVDRRCEQEPFQDAFRVSQLLRLWREVWLILIDRSTAILFVANIANPMGIARESSNLSGVANLVSLTID